MLEILMIIGLYKILKNMLANKGKGPGLAWLGPAFWFGGEIFGAVVGGVMAAAQNREPGWEIYGYAIAGAFGGAILALIIVAIQPGGKGGLLSCPSCGGEFQGQTDALGETTCALCKTRLKVSGGLVYEADKPSQIYKPPSAQAADKPPQTYQPPAATREDRPPQIYQPPSERTARPQTRYAPSYDDEDSKTPGLLIAAIAICAIIITAAIVIGFFGNTLGLFSSGSPQPGTERHARGATGPVSPENNPFASQDYSGPADTPPRSGPAIPPADTEALRLEREEHEREIREKEERQKREHDFEQWLETASMYLAEEQFKDAARSAREALKIKPDDARAKAILARASAITYVPDDFKTIQEAIDNTSAGKTIVVADGTYKGAGNRDIDFMGKPVTLKSESGPENCVIDCEKSGRGFSFTTFETGKSVLQGFTIKNGSVEGDGGAIHCSGTTNPTIIDCILVYNKAGNGGAISVWNSATPAFINCLFANNSVTGKGGAVNCWNGGSPTLINCTITGNASDKCGGGIAASERSKPILRNTIIWNNKVTKANEETTQRKLYRPGQKYRERDIKGHQVFTYDSSSTVEMYNCCMNGNTYERNSYSGKGRISSPYSIRKDPDFAGSLIGDYSLSSASPCIDKGNNSDLPNSITTDLAGRERKVGKGGRRDVVDIGAYEYQK